MKNSNNVDISIRFHQICNTIMAIKENPDMMRLTSFINIPWFRKFFEYLSLLVNRIYGWKRTRCPISSFEIVLPWSESDTPFSIILWNANSLRTIICIWWYSMKILSNPNLWQAPLRAFHHPWRASQQWLQAWRARGKWDNWRAASPQSHLRSPWSLITV